MNARILIAVVSMFVCQHVHAQNEPEAEATELEGAWESVSVVIDGDRIESDSVQLRFEGSNIVDFVYDRRGGTTVRARSLSFSIDPSAMPAAIAVNNFVIGLNGIAFNNPLGIYELDDDLLTICVRRNGNNVGRDRPDRFESSEDYPAYLIVLRRVEEKSKEKSRGTFRTGAAGIQLPNFQ